jgi:hypothetical protein
MFSPNFKKIKIASTLKNQGVFDVRRESAGPFSRRGSAIDSMSAKPQGRSSLGTVGT